MPLTSYSHNTNVSGKQKVKTVVTKVIIVVTNIYIVLYSLQSVFTYIFFKWTQLISYRIIYSDVVANNTRNKIAQY